jgi:GNAT superfamily N-acetyltransferase
VTQTEGEAMTDPLQPAEGEWHRYVTLRDGTKVLLRQIRPTDRQRIADGMKELSPASRYLRFHEAIEELSEDQLDHLTLVDHVDHEAIVAIDLDRPDVPGVGVARYIRTSDDPEVAEAAITVADRYQGTGAGTLLLGAIARRARENGVKVFRSYVLDGNHAMLEVFDNLGAHRELETDGLWRVDLAVPDDEAELPDSPAGRAFDELARGRRRLASLFPPIWGRGRGRRRGSTQPDEDELDDLGDLRADLDQWLQSRDER